MIDPVIAALTDDLSSLNVRVATVGAQLLALKVRASAFVQDELAKLDPAEAAAVRSQISPV